MDQPTTVVVSLRLEPALLARIDALARRQDRTRAWVLKRLILTTLNSHKKGVEVT